MDGEVIGAVGRGYVALVGIAKGDTEQQVDTMATRVVQLRVFEDEAGKMNRSLIDVGGQLLAVSQFTLIADLSSGRRPFFGGAEGPERASVLVDRFVAAVRSFNVTVATGRFGADMKVALVNDGPVTIVLDS